MKRIQRTKRRIKRILLGSFAFLLLLAACALYFLPDRLPAALTPASDTLREGVEVLKNWIAPQPSAPLKTYKVLRVIDGDTLLIRIDGEETPVRLIGIDAPESVHWDETKNTPEGETASAWLKAYLEGKRVSLEYDQELVDRFGRTLAYAYVDGSLLEDAILRAGMAETLSMDPNPRYELHFAAVEREARDTGAGFWGTGFFRK